MNRREFLGLVVGFTGGLMIKPIEPIVRIPNRPRVAPTLTPIASPSLMGEVLGREVFAGYIAGLGCPPPKLFVCDRNGVPMDSDWQLADFGWEPGSHWSEVSFTVNRKDA